MRSALTMPLALAGGLAILGAALLWLQFGERLFVDRILAGIAGCF